MKIFNIQEKIAIVKTGRLSTFWRDRRGEMAMNMAIYFSVFAIGAALFLPKFFENNLDKLVANDQNIDRVVTGSIRAGKVRHRVIKSVISQKAQRSCLDLKSNGC